MRGEASPFIMELPLYHVPGFKNLMLHLWDKAKHFIQKAFSIILVSCVVIWLLSNFAWDWKFVGESGMENSILASVGKFLQPIFTPLGFGSQLTSVGWVFAVAAITGLIAKENVIATDLRNGHHRTWFDFLHCIQYAHDPLLCGGCGGEGRDR